MGQFLSKPQNYPRDKSFSWWNSLYDIICWNQLNRLFLLSFFFFLGIFGDRFLGMITTKRTGFMISWLIFLNQFSDKWSLLILSIWMSACPCLSFLRFSKNIFRRHFTFLCVKHWGADSSECFMFLIFGKMRKIKWNYKCSSMHSWASVSCHSIALFGEDHILPVSNWLCHHPFSHL